MSASGGRGGAAAAAKRTDHGEVARPHLAPRDRRATSRALARWTESRPKGRIPALSDLLRQSDEISGQEFLLKADIDPHCAVFVLCGDDIQADRQETAVGTTLWEVAPKDARSDLSEACAAALAQGGVVRKEGSFQSASGTEVCYRGIFMPVRSDSRNNHGFIFGAFGSKAYGAAELAAAWARLGRDRRGAASAFSFAWNGLGLPEAKMP